MLPEVVGQPVCSLFSICVAAAAMDLLVDKGILAGSLRALCGLAAAVCALRAVLGFIQL